MPVTAPSEALRRLPRARRRRAPPTEFGAREVIVADRRRFVRRIRGDLDRIVLTALRDEPERRYASAGQLGEEIGRFLEGRAVLAQPDTLGYRVRTFVRRNRLAVTAAAVLVSCITTFGVVAALQARALAEQSRIAGLERDKAEQVVRVLVDLFETTNPAVRPDGDRMPIGQFLAGAEARALAQLSDAPLVRAKLQQVFGLIHAERGEFTPARTALEEALAAQRRLVRTRSPGCARVSAGARPGPCASSDDDARAPAASRVPRRGIAGSTATSTTRPREPRRAGATRGERRI